MYVLSRPKIELSEVDRALADSSTTWRRTESATDAEQLVEFSGRVCYMSFGNNQSPRSNAEYIANLVQMGHESVLEHVCWTFLLTGVSRSFTHQLVRHRVGFAFSQLSQQYHDETKAEFVEPKYLAAFPEADHAWSEAIKVARASYSTILEALSSMDKGGDPQLGRRETLRAIRSAARSVLPNATETKIVVTANARAIRHFLKVRGTIPGDLEMREVAAAILSVVSVDAPSLFADFRVEELSDGPIIRA